MPRLDPLGASVSTGGSRSSLARAGAGRPLRPGPEPGRRACRPGGAPTQRLEELAAELDDALAVGCDLSEPDTPAALVDAALARYGRVDLLVNNAGTNEVISALDQPPERFGAILSVNLLAPFALAQLVARDMIESATAVWS